MKIRLFLLAAWALAVFKTVSIGAHPYASGVTNLSGTISWVLNETATDTKILFDNGTVTNDLGSAPVVGTNTFALGAHTNFSIVVFKVGSNVLNQISSDANFLDNFYGPRGVAVNKNPKNGNFGRIYVASASAGAAGDARATTRGIYVLDAASEDVLSLGNTAATSGLTIGTSTTYSPYKLFVGTDDAVYVGDAGSSLIGGVGRTDPNLTGATNLFGPAFAYTNVFNAGTNFGRFIGTPNVTGSLATSNLVLTGVEWDLNLVNSSGTFGSTSNSYNNIYQYTIGAGPLPWKSFPTVITNPIGIGTANAVGMDMQTAPDGKFFVTAARTGPGDGTTNVCVLSSSGTLLWDSKTQSKNYFGDLTNDHLCFNNRSISVSPDDKYVVIQGATNNVFLMMTLTNGVPDISTLITNMTVGTAGGTTCHSAVWDAADNLYITSGGSDTLHILSLGLTTTCITSNTAAATNGTFQFTADYLPDVQVQSIANPSPVQCGSNATFTAIAYGPGIQFQWYQGTTMLAGATNSSLNLGTVSKAQTGLPYSLVVSNTYNKATSSVVTLTVVDTLPPVITLNGTSPLKDKQGVTYVDPGATASDTCAGSISVSTSNPVNSNVAGTYTVTYTATDPSGNTGTATRTVYVLATNGPAAIIKQPASQVAQCTASATFSVIASGLGPLHYQWYSGTTALVDGANISGSGTSDLILSGILLSQSGSYKVVVTNTSANVTSTVVSLTVNDVSPPVVTVLGNAAMNLVQGATFTDPGATASDACAGTLAVSTNGSVNTSVPGIYVLVYSAVNSGGLSASAQRIVTVKALPGVTKASPPSIIPLPVTLQTNAGTFTLCPSQPIPPAPALASMQILVDASSLQNGQYLAAALFKATGYQFQVVSSTSTNTVKNAILITVSNAISTLGAEGYELTVAPDSVLIRAPAQGGAFYGVQSLLQLLPPQIYSPRIVPGVPWVAPCVYVQDKPSYSWRGLMLDVARHFFNKEEVKQVLDAMAMHKLNTFHWHLVDDQGWRLEMTNYPNLTGNAAFRNGPDYGLPVRSNAATNSAGQYGGFYTQAQAREIVAYAAARHITVVPEIEMPCHSTPGLVAYPQFGCGNPGNFYDMDYPDINYGVDLYSLGTPGTLAFLKDTLTEVMGIFPGTYIHCGGDEVVSSGDLQWNTYNADVTNMAALGITPNGTTSVVQYQHWFSTNIASFLQANGRVMIGWTEFENGGVITNAALMDWETGTSSQATNVAKAGMPVVMSPNASCYINYVEGSSANLSNEPPFVVGGSPSYLTVANVYAFNPIPTGLAAAYTNNILGAQCNAWGEYIPSFRNAMFKIFPRETALAEVTWTPLASQSYTNFTNRLVVEEQRFAQLGLNYDHENIPVAGTWGPTVSGTPATVNIDITTNITSAGEIDVNFWYNSGSALSISSVALLQNGVQVDADIHAGYSAGSPVFPIYVLHLPETKPGATYTLQAVINGYGGATTASGTIYLPNWN